MKIKIKAKTILKTPTNEGDPCKQYFYIMTAEDVEPKYDTALIIKKLVLIDSSRLPDYGDYLVLRAWKDNKLLVFKRFGIKSSTLKLALDKLLEQ